MRNVQLCSIALIQSVRGCGGLGCNRENLYLAEFSTDELISELKARFSHSIDETAMFQVIEFCIEILKEA